MALECFKNIKLPTGANKLHGCACVGLIVFAIIICLLVFLVPSENDDYSIDSFGATSQEVLPETGCPLGWLSVENNCFRIQSMDAMIWGKAEEFCEDMGGFLAEPRTKQTLATINSFIKLSRRNEEVHWWIGLTDRAHEGKWLWMHETRYNSELDSSGSWVPWLGGSYSKEIHNHNDCVIIHTGGGGSDSLQWEDVDCFIDKYQGKEIYAICEREKEGRDGGGFEW